MRVIAVALAALVVAQAPAVAGGVQPDLSSWRPGVSAAERYAKMRLGSARFAIIGPEGDLSGFHADRTAPIASVIKAMLLVSYLRLDSVRDRSLDSHDRGLLKPMITRSDNAAATRVNAIVGGRIRRLAGSAQMRDFHYNPSVWGLSRSSPRDQARFFYDLERFIPARHVAFALHLLANVVPSQRWGVGRVNPPGWQLYFKGGWGSGSGRVDHQVALLENGDARISLAIFTEFNPSHGYGKRTLEGVASRLLAGLPG